jgi:uncharacterized protein YecT (DUF1311 family)
MKKLFFLLLLSFISFCTLAQKQGDLNEISYKEYLKADKELNVVYQKIIVKYAKNAPFIKALRESQRIWVKFRKSEINMKYPESDGYGSSLPMCISIFSEDFTKQRTNYLKKWLKTELDNDMCGGSLRSYESY